MKLRSWIVLFVVVAALGGAGWGYSKFGKKPGEVISEKLLVTVKKSDLKIDVLETGKVQPREKVEIKSKVAGQVERVYVDAGATIKKGQMLLRLDTTDYRREVERAQGEIDQAKIGLELAQLTLARREKALETRSVAEVEVELGRNDVKAKQVAVERAKVALSAAQDRLRYCEIASPMNGTVIERGIQPGEVVTPGVQATFEGKPLLTIADLSTLIVKVDLNQIDIAKVKLGQKVTLTLDALPGKTYAATLTKVAPASTLPKGKEVDVFPVEATLDAADSSIKPGMTADVRIHIETKSSILTLPIEAIVKEAGQVYANRVTKDEQGKQKSTRVAIKLGARNDREVEVTEGIAEGEQVLIKPASSLENEYKM